MKKLRTIVALAEAKKDPLNLSRALMPAQVHRHWHSEVAPRIEKHAHDLINNGKMLSYRHPSFPQVNIEVRHKSPKSNIRGDYNPMPVTGRGKIRLNIDAANPHKPEHVGTLIHELGHHLDYNAMNQRFGFSRAMQFHGRAVEKGRDTAGSSESAYRAYLSDPGERRAHEGQVKYHAHLLKRKMASGQKPTEADIPNVMHSFMGFTSQATHNRVMNSLKRHKK